MAVRAAEPDTLPRILPRWRPSRARRSRSQMRKMLSAGTVIEPLAGSLSWLEGVSHSELHHTAGPGLADRRLRTAESAPRRLRPGRERILSDCPIDQRSEWL